MRIATVVRLAAVATERCAACARGCRYRALPPRPCGAGRRRRMRVDLFREVIKGRAAGDRSVGDHGLDSVAPLVSR